MDCQGRLFLILQLMSKQQQAINKKIEGLLFALKIKDPVSLQSNLEDISQTGKTSKEETIEKYKEQISGILPLQALRKRKQMSQKLALNKKVIEIVEKGKELMSAVEALLAFNYAELERGQTLLIQAMESLNTFESLSGLKYSDFPKIRQQLYLQISAKIERVEQDSDVYINCFKESLQKLQMPLKKEEVRKEQPDGGFVLDFVRALHRESCILSLKKQLCCLLQKEDQSNGRLLEIYWAPSVKASIYHFVSGSELHNLEEPGWMFEYLQQVLSTNYKYILNFILKPLREEIAHSIGSHFLSGSAYFLFMRVIEARIKEDLQQMNPFLSFTFLQELSALEDKLFGLFGLRAGFLETVLLNHELLLHRAFQYQNQRFETKVFEDFININYSQINLKNLQAYNLMVAFLNLLDRLYRKFHLIKNSTLKKQIHRFYRDRIKALVSHLRTSFDRIYLHSRLPRLDILISFKRTQNQLRSSLTQLTQADSQLQDSLQKEYYGFLQQYYEACALQALTSVHKKLHISLGDIINKLESTDDSNHDQLLLAFNKIHQEWAQKMDQICKFSRYVDNKLRTIFFTYLEGTSFSLVGLNLFLKIFQPYLQVIFNEQRHRNLISLITVSRQRYLQQLQAQPDILSFLTQDQLSKLKNFKYANPNL